MSSTFWAGNVIALGLWEGIALKTKALPTISETIAHCRARQPVLTLAIVTLWILGLTSYLYTRKIE